MFGSVPRRFNRFVVAILLGFFLLPSFLAIFLPLTEFYRVFSILTGFYRIVPSFLDFDWVFTKLNRVLLVLPSFTEFSRFYWVLPSFLDFYWI